MRILGKVSWLVLLALVLVSVLSAATSNASAQEPLRWKFEVGQKLNYNMVQEMSIGSTGGPFGAQNVTMNQEMDMTWNVMNINEVGEAVIQQKFDRMKMKMTLPPPVGVLEYDSKSEAAPTGVAAMFAPMYKALTEAEFELIMTPRGEIKDVKVPDEVMAALKNSPGGMAMGDLATPEGFKKMISQGALVLPEKAPELGRDVITLKGSGNKKSPTFKLTSRDALIRYSYDGDPGAGIGAFAVYLIEAGKDFDKVGGIPEITTQAVKEESESALHKDPGKYYLNVAAAGNWEVTVEEGGLWSTKVELNNPTGGKQIVETTYRFDGTKEVEGVTYAVFRPDLKMSFEGNDQMKVKEQKSSGEILFNVDAGRLHSSTLDQEVAMEQAGGVQAKIDQSINVKVTPAEVEAAGVTTPDRQN